MVQVVEELPVLLLKARGAFKKVPEGVVDKGPLELTVAQGNLIKTLQLSLEEVQQALTNADTAFTAASTSSIVMNYVLEDRELLKKSDEYGHGLMEKAAFGYINGHTEVWELLVELLRKGARSSEAFMHYLKTTLSDEEKKIRHAHVRYIVEMAENAAREIIEEFPEYPQDPSLILGQRFSSIRGFLGW
ncbi:hypothetical protein H0W26_01885 [Candidatus Dependentiae bacterium]|nr:hypothetical protein [Candidatus Dependentiae bacterium]